MPLALEFGLGITPWSPLKSGKKLTIVANQSFAVTFENTKTHEYLWINAVDADKVLYVFLLDGKTVVFKMADPSEAEFESIAAVDFLDLNKDGLKDVIIISAYHPLAGLDRTTGNWLWILINTGGKQPVFKTMEIPEKCDHYSTLSQIEKCFK